MQQKRTLRWLPWLVLGLALLFPLVTTRAFLQHIGIMICMYATLGLAWDVLGGHAGQVSLGHAAYFGLGAYTSAMLFKTWHVTPLLGMWAGVVVAVSISLLIGWPTFRLAGHYFAIATLGVVEIIRVVFTKWDWVEGSKGLELPFDKHLLSMQFTSKLPYYYWILALLVLVMLVSRATQHSKLGYYLQAIKQSPRAAQSLGVDVGAWKLVAMAISAGAAALVGSFYAQYVLFLDPDSTMSIALSVQICLVAVLGGSGSIWGPVIGAAILVPLSEFSRVWLGGQGRGLDLMIYGALITVITLVEPRGITGLLSPRKREAAQARREPLDHSAVGSD